MRRHRAPSPPSERVVVFRYDKVGDLLVSSPIFSAIRAARPNALITLVGSAANETVLRGLPEIDEFLIYDDAWRWSEKLAFARRLRAMRPAMTIVLSPRTAAYFLALFSGARRRGGILMSYRLAPRLLAPLLLTVTERIDRGRSAPRHHTAAVLSLAGKLGFPVAHDAPQRVPPVPALTAAFATRFAVTSPRIVIQLAAKSDTAAFSGAVVIDLAAKIRRRHPAAGVVVCAGPAERGLTIPLARAFAGAGHPLIAENLAFAQWSALIAAADLVITPDCGAVHLAAAHGRPVVVLYAPYRMARALAEFGPWQVPFRAVPIAGAGTLVPAVLTAMEDLFSTATTPAAA